MEIPSLSSSEIFKALWAYLLFVIEQGTSSSVSMGGGMSLTHDLEPVSSSKNPTQRFYSGTYSQREREELPQLAPFDRANFYLHLNALRRLLA